MKSETLKLFRINILTQLRAAGRLGLTVKELVVNAKSTGFPDTSEDDVKDEIEYLTDKKHVKKLPQEISPEVESFAITGDGRDWLATQGL